MTLTSDAETEFTVAESGGAPQKPPFELKGRHVLLGALTAFGVILTANMTMLYSALHSFPGLVVKNSYVASQGFNARKQAQIALGWRAAIGHEDGLLTVALSTRSGSPAVAEDVTAVFGRPTDNRSDVAVALSRDPATGRYVGATKLAPGRWRVSVSAQALNGQPFAAEARIFVR